jgi:uncharacterized protein (TIGR02271 family)
MTMHADQLVGATVTDSDGLPVGTVEQVFRDDVDGTPSWARIRSATGLHFVPLAGSKITRGGGLCVPFDSRKILGEPRISVDRHMSVEQEEQLRQHFGIRVPPQPTRAEAQAMQAQKEKAESGEGKTAESLGGRELGGEELGREARGRKSLADDESLTGPARPEHGEWSSDWVIRSEERIAIDLETCESGRVTVRKYVDAEPVQQTVRVFHEELEIERVPISEEDQVTGNMAESEQEIILHEARAKITKETFPVERVRLSVRKVEEDKTVSGEIRKERIEVVDDGSATKPPRQ